MRGDREWWELHGFDDSDREWGSDPFDQTDNNDDQEHAA